MRKSTYVVLDVETTGLSPDRHGLTELYAARTDSSGNIIDSFHSLANPGHSIPRFITRLTGITDEMVRDAPTPEEVVKSFTGFVNNDDILVGHNISFDLSFLNHYKTNISGETFSNKTLCTLLLARRALCNNPLPSYKLGNLAKSFNIEIENAHRAGGDVKATIKVQQAIFNILENSEICEIEDVLKLQRTPIRKAAQIITSPQGQESR